MPKRTYWDRTLYKDVRVPYRKKKTKGSKEKYTSKAYRRYCKYLADRFGPGTFNLLGRLMSEQVQHQLQRPGFARRILGRQVGVDCSEPEYSDWYKAYKAEDVGFYNPKKAYKIPDVWITWDEETNSQRN